MSPPDIQQATHCFLAGHLERLAIETVDYLCFKLLQYREVTGNAWGASKHVAGAVVAEWLFISSWLAEQEDRG